VFTKQAETRDFIKKLLVLGEFSSISGYNSQSNNRNISMNLLVTLSDTLMTYGSLSYVVMFLILIACGFGLPLPEDVVLVTGGILVAAGVCTFNMTLAVTMAGVLLGDGIIFHLGRHFGPRITTRWPFKLFLTEERLVKAREVFANYGPKVVFVARFMPGLRMPTYLTSGSFGVPPWKFWFFDGLAAILSVPLWIYVGKVFGENLEQLEKVMRQMQQGILLLVLIAVLVFVAVIMMKKKRNEAPNPSPSSGDKTH